MLKVIKDYIFLYSLEDMQIHTFLYSPFTLLHFCPHYVSHSCLFISFHDCMVSTPAGSFF